MPRYTIKQTAYTPVSKEQQVEADSLEEALNQVEEAGTWELLATGESLDLSQDLLHDCQVESIYDEEPSYAGELSLGNVKPEGAVTSAKWQGKPIKINQLGEQ